MSSLEKFLTMFIDMSRNLGLVIGMMDFSIGLLTIC